MERLLKKITAQIIAHYDPQQIVLFGSAAKDQWRADSDLDILVIGRFALPPALRGQELRGLWHSFPLPIDVLYFTPEEVAEHCRRPNSFIASALQTGKIIFEKN